MAEKKQLNTVKPSVKQLKTLDILLKRRYSLIYGGRRCLNPDTLVLTKNGYKEIKDIEIGDEVPSLCKNKEIQYKKVTDKFLIPADGKNQKVITFTLINNTKITCSYGHKLYVEGRYVKAVDIARRAMERSDRVKWEIQNIEHGSIGFFELLCTRIKQWTFGYNEARIRRKRIFKDNDPFKWEVQNSKNAQACCSTLGRESREQTAGEPHQPYQVGQQGGELGMGNIQGEHRPHDESGQTVRKSWRKMWYKHFNRRSGKGYKNGILAEGGNTKDVGGEVRLLGSLYKGYYNEKELVARSLDIQDIKSIEFSPYPELLYDIEIEDNHNYFITKDNIISHNSGKTFIILFFILLRAKKVKSRHVIVRFHFADLKKSMMKDTFPKVCAAMNLEYTMNNQDNYARLPNGSEIWFCGIDEARGLDKVLGTEYSTMFFNEASQIKYSTYQFVLSSLAEKSGLRTAVIIDENPPLKSHWTYKVFFEGIDPVERTLIPNFKENYEHYRINPSDNLENIDSEYMEQLNNLPPKLRKRFRDGEFGDDIIGALFTEKNINKNRIIVDADIRDSVIYDLELIEIVVSVDPAISSSAQSDETGIVVVGRDARNKGYVLEDLSGIYKPSEWAAIAVDLYRKYDADAVVGEINQGGEMVEHTVKVEDENVTFKAIRATKGKILRAEPISAIYEDDRVCHVGSFPDLEEEMVTYTGTKGEKSPNRLDALVHGLTSLFPVDRERESEYFRSKLVFMSSEQGFEGATNIGYINIGSAENYNFTFLSVKLKDGRVFITDVLFNDSFPNENMEGIKELIGKDKFDVLYIECNPSYAPFVREITDMGLCDIRGIKSVEDNTNRILIESDFIIKKMIVKKDPTDVQYKDFLRQLNAYTSLSEKEDRFAANALSGLANVLKKLYQEEIN